MTAAAVVLAISCWHLSRGRQEGRAGELHWRMHTVLARVSAVVVLLAGDRA
jgi:2-keto-4-pentenoate hydratase/2-oxohepta-3-ene-1,7-dioic acid hydratase in catechol pathway